MSDSDYQRGITDGIAAERRRIVAMLRREARKVQTSSRAHFDAGRKAQAEVLVNCELELKHAAELVASKGRKQ